jgi:hypothetical protein
VCAPFTRIHSHVSHDCRGARNQQHRARANQRLRFSDLNDPFELMAVNCREHRTRNVIRGFKDSYNSHTGLLCFSADWTKSVLGSRYGTKHHGVYLGFNLVYCLINNVTDYFFLRGSVDPSWICSTFARARASFSMI